MTGKVSQNQLSTYVTNKLSSIKMLQEEANENSLAIIKLSIFSKLQPQSWIFSSKGGEKYIFDNNFCTSER
jgi:hypothetical protein